MLVTENQGYEGFTHRRSVFFVGRKYFVIVDEAYGPAAGTVNLNYQMPMGQIQFDTDAMTAATAFDDGSNMVLKCFAPKGAEMVITDGWHSPAYRTKLERKKISFNTAKAEGEVTRYITVIVPKDEPGDDLKITASFISKAFSQNSLSVQVKVGKDSKQKLSYELK